MMLLLVVSPVAPASAVDTATVPVQTAYTGSSGSCSTFTEITSGFNGNRIDAGNYIWFNSVMKLTSPVPSGGLVVDFTGQTITISSSAGSSTIMLPDSEIDFSTSATTATTMLTGTGWLTTVPASFGDNVFLSGVAYQPPGGLTGGSVATWSGEVTSNSPMSMNWQWGAAVYTSFDNIDYNNDGIKPVHSTSLDAYHNGDQAGTPENYKSFVVGGATGGGGSNWTGSYSGTAAASTFCGGFTLLVNATDERFGDILNVPVEISQTQNGLPTTLVAAGLTPIMTSVTLGQTYAVTLDTTSGPVLSNHGPIFCGSFHWSDSTTDNPKFTTITGDTTLTAIYDMCTG